MNNSGIDPAVIKFATALVAGSLIVEALDRLNEGAAWVLVFILLFGVFLNNPILIGAITNGANSLAQGVSNG